MGRGSYPGKYNDGNDSKSSLKDGLLLQQARTVGQVWKE